MWKPLFLELTVPSTLKGVWGRNGSYRIFSGEQNKKEKGKSPWEIHEGKRKSKSTSTRRVAQSP
jgi:hypothetical protein